MNTPAILVSAVYPRGVCACLVELGYDVRPWLQAADIDPGDFYHSDATITVGQFDRLLGAAEFSTGRADIGLMVGKSVRVTSHGSLGFAMVSASTAREAMEMACRYYRMLNPLHAMSMHDSGPMTTLQFRRTAPMPLRVSNMFEEAIGISAMAQVISMSAPFVPRFDIRLSMPAPAHLAEYRQFKQARFCFADKDVDGVSITFERKALDAANPLSDPGSVRLAEEICRRKVAELDRVVGWKEWVAKALRASGSARVTRSELAKLLNISPRSLARALASEGCSFKEICEQVGHERACAMLAEGNLTMADIAHRLGYLDQGSFCRAFKRRAGMTPTQFIEGI